MPCGMGIGCVETVKALAKTRRIVGPNASGRLHKLSLRHGGIGGGQGCGVPPSYGCVEWYRRYENSFQYWLYPDDRGLRCMVVIASGSTPP